MIYHMILPYRIIFQFDPGFVNSVIHDPAQIVRPVSAPLNSKGILTSY